MSNITVIDSLMGTGKSTYAINSIVNENIIERRYLCVLPTLDECERYKDSINAEISSPECWGSKQKHLQHLIATGRNIATTHALIKQATETTLELLAQSNYTLIIDECLNVVDKYNKVTYCDIATLFDGEYVKLDDKMFLVWNDEKYENYIGRFDDVHRLCNMKSLMAHNNQDGRLSKILIWNFPTEFFTYFDESYIMTYCWNGSFQKNYFDLHRVSYQHKTLYDNELVPYDEKLEMDRRREISKLINVYDGKLNDIGNKISRQNPLCKSWYGRHKDIDGGYLLKKLKQNIENYFRHVVNSPSDDNMYTTFEPFENFIRGKGYTKGFVTCNSKGTNNYRNKKALAYTINLFPNKEVLDFFKANNIEVNQDLYSLCELLQWIWRSQIRDGKPINIYVPSERMRFLLESWMECNEMDSISYYGNKAA